LGKTETGTAEEQPVRDILIDWNGQEEVFMHLLLLGSFHEQMPQKTFFYC